MTVSDPDDENAEPEPGLFPVDWVAPEELDHPEPAPDGWDGAGAACRLVVDQPEDDPAEPEVPEVEDPEDQPELDPDVPVEEPVDDPEGLDELDHPELDPEGFDELDHPDDERDELLLLEKELRLLELLASESAVGARTRSRAAKIASKRVCMGVEPPG